MTDQSTIYPYYPAQIVPIGLTIRTHDNEVVYIDVAAGRKDR